jgi:ribosomal protein S18 acetylase RimI-like enzyme
MYQYLYRIYDYVVANSFADVAQAGNFKIVTSAQYGWPNLCYLSEETDSIESEHIKLLKSKLEVIASKNNNTIAVLINENALNAEIQQTIISEGFAPVTKWVNMKLELTSTNETETSRPANVDVIEVKLHSEISSWKNLAGMVLFKGAQLNENLFIKGVSDGYFRLFQTLENGLPVATVLLCMEQTPCIYMVATHNEHRRKGLAKLAMQAAHHAAGKAGAESVMLQSTKEGLKLYQNMGYLPINNVYLFYKKQL